MGMQLDRPHVFAARGGPSNRPDFFDHPTRIAYEVKTGRHSLTSQSLSQILAYEHAIKTRRAKLIAYLKVAFENKAVLAARNREEFRRRGFRLLMLR